MASNKTEPASSAPGVAAGLLKFGFAIQTITTLVAPARAAQASADDSTLLLYKVVPDSTGVESELRNAGVLLKAASALARYKEETKKTLVEEISLLEAKLDAAKQSLEDLESTDTTPHGKKRCLPEGGDSEDAAPKIHKPQPAPEPPTQPPALTEVPVIVSDGEQQHQAPGAEGNTGEEEKEEEAEEATPSRQDQSFVYNTMTLTKNAVLCAVARQLTGSPGAVIDMVLLLGELGLPASAGDPLRVWYAAITGTHLSSPLQIQAAAE